MLLLSDASAIENEGRTVDAAPASRVTDTVGVASNGPLVPTILSGVICASALWAAMWVPSVGTKYPACVPIAVVYERDTEGERRAAGRERRAGRDMLRLDSHEGAFTATAT